eukprot:scaffold184_cov179-Amphora_coffeaeformis.AAC.20
MYAAAAVLGMPSETQQDRLALCEAVCGNVKGRYSSLRPATGLNRSSFNLLSFLIRNQALLSCQ